MRKPREIHAKALRKRRQSLARASPKPCESLAKALCKPCASLKALREHCENLASDWLAEGTAIKCPPSLLLPFLNIYILDTRLVSLPVKPRVDNVGAPLGRPRQLHVCQLELLLAQPTWRLFRPRVEADQDPRVLEDLEAPEEAVLHALVALSVAVGGVPEGWDTRRQYGRTKKIGRRLTFETSIFQSQRVADRRRPRSSNTDENQTKKTIHCIEKPAVYVFDNTVRMRSFAVVESRGIFVSCRRFFCDQDCRSSVCYVTS